MWYCILRPLTLLNNALIVDYSWVTVRTIALVTRFYMIEWFAGNQVTFVFVQ